MNYLIRSLLEKRRWLALLFVIIVAWAVFFTSSSSSPKSVWKFNKGAIFGTTYHIKYQSEKDYQSAFDSVFSQIDQSLSTYNKKSLISRWNRGEKVMPDAMFTRMVVEGKKYNKQTQGYLDPTIGDVVNAWGFGSKTERSLPDSTVIDSLMRYVGIQKLHFENNYLIKTHRQTYLEFNSYAKGYSLDCIAALLEQKQVKNYMIEIGGEIRCKGLNHKKKKWVVGIDKPLEGASKSTFSAKVTLTNTSMATSGNYRKFHIDETGKKYVHIINPYTGYPSRSNLLSTVVIAKDCMTADAYATALMAMGLDKAKSFLTGHPQMEAMLLFSDKKGNIKIWTTEKFPTAKKVN